MKNIGILVSAIAIAAGIIAGRLDHEDARARRAESEEEAQASSISRAPELGPSRGGARGGDAARGAGAPQEAAPRSRSTAPPASSRGGGPSVAERLSTVSRLIAEQDFEAAEEEAGAVLRIASGPERDEAARLAAKARAFAAVIAALPEPPAPTTGKGPGPGEGGASKGADAAGGARGEPVALRLSSGARVRGRLLEETSRGYVIQLEGGGTYAPRREDVAIVERQGAGARAASASGGPAAAPATASAEAPSAIDEPIRLFREDVARSYREGRKAEGLALLETILAMPASDQIPLLFVPGADAQLVKDWRVAGGRAAPEVAAAPRRAEPEEAEPEERPEEHGSLARPNPEHAPAAADPASIARAAILFGQGQALYQTGARQEGREEDLVKARAALEKAQSILERLPSDDEEVQKLSRQVSQLLSDVARASPF